MLALIFLGYLWIPQVPALASAVFQIPGLNIASFPATPALLTLLGLFVADNFALDCYFQKIALDRGRSRRMSRWGRRSTTWPR